MGLVCHKALGEQEMAAVETSAPAGAPPGDRPIENKVRWNDLPIRQVPLQQLPS